MVAYVTDDGGEADLTTVNDLSMCLTRNSDITTGNILVCNKERRGDYHGKQQVIPHITNE